MRDVVVDSLATYRLTLLAIEDVITEPLREKIFEKHPPFGKEGQHTWSFALTCPWCVSMWIGAGVMLARRFAPKKWDILAKALAASAVTGVAYGKLN